MMEKKITTAAQQYGRVEQDWMEKKKKETFVQIFTADHIVWARREAFVTPLWEPERLMGRR